MTLATHLPPELVIRVLDFVDPPALIDLACTCQFLEKCSRDILRKHRASHARYRVVTDIAPRSLTEVLRKALVDHHLAWHVRELEFTRDRTEWMHWEKFDDIEELEGTETAHVSPPPDFAFTQDEQANLLNQLREVFRFDEEQTEKAYEDLQHGNDAPLKLLLLGACPRVRSVKFARNVRLTGNGTIERVSPNDHDIPRSGLEYFHQAIVNQLQNQSAAWPAGLDSLRDLAIGVETEDETSNSTFAPPPPLFANCMRLPHLISLYCFGLEIHDHDNEAEVHYEIEKRSSSVQHMFFDCTHGHHAPMKGIILGCTELKSLVIAGGEVNDIDAVVEFAGCYWRSLETLMFYETNRFSGYRSSMCRPEYIAGLSSLRTIYVDADDVMLDAYYHYKGDVECGRGNNWISDSQFFIRFCMESAFPNSTEVLVLGAWDRFYLREGDADLFDQAITTMIEYGRVTKRDDEEDRPADSSAEPATTFEGCYPNLKAIYVDSLEDTRNISQARHRRWFSKAIAAGRKFGVDVHTGTTRGQSFHQVDFPKRPMMASTKIEEDFVFDIYTGRWAPPRCGNCGKCEKCLEQYDASVWKEVEDELERGQS
jgi:hypothetical protein